MAIAFVNRFASANNKNVGTTTVSGTTVFQVPANNWIVGFGASDNIGLTTGRDTNDHSSFVVGGIALTKLLEHRYAPTGVAAQGVTGSIWLGKATSLIALGAAFTFTTSAGCDAKAATAGQFTATNLTLRGFAADIVLSNGTAQLASLTGGPVGGPTSQHLALRHSVLESAVVTVSGAAPWGQDMRNATSGGATDTNVDNENFWLIESTAQSTSSAAFGGITARRSEAMVILGESVLAAPGGPRMIV